MANLIIEILSGIAVSLASVIGTFVIAQWKKTKAYGRGIQALLRNELYAIYRECIKKGYASVLDKNNFENLYVQYHALGKNGVMTSYRDEILTMKESKSKVVRK